MNAAHKSMIALTVEMAKALAPLGVNRVRVQTSGIQVELEMCGRDLATAEIVHASPSLKDEGSPSQPEDDPTAFGREEGDAPVGLVLGKDTRFPNRET